MNPILTKSSRLFLISKTAFYIFYYFYYQADHLTEGISFYVIKDAVFQFLNQTFVMHAMNTLIITYCLINTFDDLCLNRISSLPLDNFFGQMRILCRDFDSFENFLRGSVKAYMNINLMNNFNYTPSIKKRINSAGIKITKDSGDMNFYELNCLSENAALRCFLLANMNVEDIYKIQPDLTSFDNFISHLYVIGSRKTQCPIHLNRPKISLGMSIKARCSCAYYENKLQQGFI
ncbi:hypothetical protein M9Y10_025248 [Tritrichomonas musculus]|uniref:Uncharacterized protein n=1 Tax=Tritrichomonas musculus TaxID=1915356 RepID=A0ABR2H9Z7_9EUKA